MFLDLLHAWAALQMQWMMVGGFDYVMGPQRDPPVLATDRPPCGAHGRSENAVGAGGADQKQ